MGLRHKRSDNFKHVYFLSMCISWHVLFISTGFHEPMVISVDFQRVTYAQDLTYLRHPTRIWTRTRIPCCIALLPCLATLCSCLAFLPCLSALPCCLALACRCYFAWLSAFAALLAVVPCPALRFALPCLALPCGMDVKPTWANMATLAYRVDNVDLNPKINELGGTGRDVAFACTRPGCRARRPRPLG